MAVLLVLFEAVLVGLGVALVFTGGVEATAGTITDVVTLIILSAFFGAAVSRALPKR